MRKIVVIGSRDWKDGRRIVRRLLDEPDGTHVITGGGRGADYFAEHGALAIGFTLTVDKADWDAYGLSAGPRRNRVMLDRCPNRVIAFHSNIEASKGTLDCITEAGRRGIDVELITR